MKPSPFTSRLREPFPRNPTIRHLMWIALSGLISVLGFWYPLLAGLTDGGESDYRGGIVTLFFSPIMLAGAIWTANCLKHIWNDEPAIFPQSKELLKKCAMALALVSFLPAFFVATIIFWGFLFAFTN